jgi:hypothetical protein
MQTRVYLHYRFFEPHPMLRNEWIELKPWEKMGDSEREECQWKW